MQPDTFKCLRLHVRLHVRLHTESRKLPVLKMLSLQILDLSLVDKSREALMIFKLCHD